MSVIALTVYTLVWPVIVAGTLLAILGAFARDVSEAKRKGKRIV